MSKSNKIDPISISIVACGVLLSLGGWLLGGDAFGAAVAVGAVCAVFNWVLSRAALSRVVRGGKTASAWGGVMLVKFGLLAAILWVLVIRLEFDGIGVLVGLSAMALGTVVGSALTVAGRSAQISEEVVQDA